MAQKLKNKKTKFILRPIIQLAAMALLVYADYLLKLLAEDRLSDGGTHVLIKGFLGLYYTQNTGAAFSMFSASTDLLSIVTGIAIAAGIIWLVLPKDRPLIYDICVPLIIAGGAGNLLDRLLRGYVIDYIRTLFMDFPIFNFADILITCGAFTLVIYLIYEIVTESSRQKKVIPTSAIVSDGETDD